MAGSAPLLVRTVQSVASQTMPFGSTMGGVGGSEWGNRPPSQAPATPRTRTPATARAAMTGVFDLAGAAFAVAAAAGAPSLVRAARTARYCWATARARP